MTQWLPYETVVIFCRFLTGSGNAHVFYYICALIIGSNEGYDAQFLTRHSPNVLSHHHVQNRQQFLTGDALVIVQVVHLECNCNGVW